jgi:uncharacterized protein (TIGR03435 family)
VHQGGGGCGPMTTIASMVSRRMQGPVVDKTGLTGLWDFFLFFSGNGNRASLPTAGSTTDSAIPNFAEALQDQLGLKMESSRGLVETLVIDSARQPTEN